MRVPPEHRHAYEVIDGPCDLFLERHGSVLAEAVEAAACTVVAELAAEQRLQVRIDTIVLDCDHAAKFSRYLLVRVMSHGGEPVLWRGPRDVPSSPSWRSWRATTRPRPSIGACTPMGAACASSARAS